MMEFYYSLLNPSRFCQLAQIYSRQPSEWEPSTHPYWDEPTGEDELSCHSQPLYGVESLFRTQLVAHPAAEPRALMFCSTDLDLRVPVLLNPRESTSVFDCFLADSLRPFVLGGHGMVICPVCVVAPHEGKLAPVLLSRTQFVIHYDQLHFKRSIVAGLYFPTGYHYRIYMATALFHMILPYRNMGDGDLNASPVDPSCFTNYKVEFDDDFLRRFLPKETYPGAPHRPPAGQVVIPPAPVGASCLEESVEPADCEETVLPSDRVEHPPESLPEHQATPAPEAPEVVITGYLFRQDDFPTAAEAHKALGLKNPKK
jgi:hypothetical protein